MDTETEVTIETNAKARKPRTRISHERSRFVHATNRYRRDLGADFDAPDLLRMTTVSEDEFAAVRARLLEGIAAALGAVASPLPGPGPDLQIKEWDRWCHMRGALFIRNAEQLETIKKKLIELGPGAELVPMYAMSVGVKLRSGKFILIDNFGNETKG